MAVELLTGPRALADLPPDARLALDTEFHAERRYTPILHLIQIQADVPGSPSWILDPHDPAVLASCAPEIVRRPWIVHAGAHDVALLRSALGGLPDVILDTQIADGLVRPVWPASLARLASHWLGRPMDKGETLSDWSRRPLTPSQIAYAAGDVQVLHDLWAAIDGEASRVGRSDVVRDACSRAADEAIAGPDPDLAWCAVPGHGSLDGPGLSVLQELAAWREITARDTDQPAHAVLPNRTLMDLAKRRPLTAGTLLAGRGAPRSTLQRHEAELLDRIARATRRPEWAWPAAIRPGTPASARAAWLRAWAEITGMREGWSHRLVLPEPIQRAIALGLPVDPGWRRSFLEPILADPPQPIPFPDLGILR